MCGIAGYVGPSAIRSLYAALEAMAHRGPDGKGIQERIVGNFSIGLGHVRLSILDLSEAANQPFASEDGTVVLAFNGEIYNHSALRQELSQLGRTFRTRSDTEVLLASYQEWGRECLSRLEGMYAFAILDASRNVLFLGRDSFGIKPLYLMGDPKGDGFFFASEIRGIRALARERLRPDPSCYAEFLLNGFLYEPKSGFAGVRKLAPGEALEVRLDSGVMHYWQHGAERVRPPELDFPALIKDSMHLQSLADVKVGLFFSGGIDSSVLAAASDQPLMALHALFPDSEGSLDGDSAFAQAVAEALGLEVENVVHAAEQSGVEHILADFREVARGTEEPISDYTFVASSLISQMARERGYKVMLSGMGGDELFGGYPRYVPARYVPFIRFLRPGISLSLPILRKSAGLAKKADRLLRFASERNFPMAYTSLLGYFGTDEVATMLGSANGVRLFGDFLQDLVEPVRSQSYLKQAMYMDRFGFLAHNLTVTDKSSMAKSIEVRVPLLSRELGALGMALPDHALQYKGKGKKPLRDFLSGRLPSRLIDRPKVGFNPPLDGKIALLGKELIADLLSGGAVADVINPSFSRLLVDQHFSGAANHSYRLWQLIYFSLWLDEAAAWQ